MYVILLLAILFIVLHEIKKPELFSNYCKKPFKPTCNKDKIFSRIRYLEEKMDELEYDIFRMNSKNRRKKYEKEIELNNKAKEEANKLRNKSLNDLKKQQREMDKLASQNKLKKRLEDEERERQFKMKQTQKMGKTLKNIKKNNTNNSITLSGSGNTVDNLQDYVDETTDTLDVDETKEMKGEVKNLDMPPGYVF